MFNFNQRVNSFRQIFEAKEIEAFFISNFYNIFYLTGFQTLTKNEREAFLLITKKNTYLFTDGRYINIKDENSKSSQILKLLTPKKGLIKNLSEIFDNEKIKICGVEGDDLTVSEFQRLIKFFSETKFIPLEKLIIKQREIKDEEEINHVKKACEITDQCFSEILPLVKTGMSEKEVSFLIERWIREKGYDLAFDPIIAVDQHSAIPHYQTKEGDGRIRKNSIILFDFGVKYNHYISDITRMIFFKPQAETLKIYEELLKIQEKTINLIEKEKNPKVIDRFCRDELIKKNLPDFPHSLGHGVGLEIHEYPKISQKSDDMICDHQIFTIEPGIYFPGRWGMRIEDTVTIKNNKVERLTKFPKIPYVI